MEAALSVAAFFAALLAALAFTLWWGSWRRR